MSRWFPLALLALTACQENGFSSIVDTSVLGDTGTPDVEDPPPNTREPIADAGTDQTVGTGVTVHLDGTASYDPDGLEPLAYLWTVDHKPAETTSDLNDPTSATPLFTADTVGTWVLDLTVQNTAGVWDSTPARVVVHVESAPPAPAPVANAGPDKNAMPGDEVAIDGSGSTDPQGLYPLAYQWTLVTTPSGSAAVIAGAGATVNLVPDVDGDYTVELGVKNSAGTADPTPDRMVVHVTSPPPLPPVADAGPDLTAYRGDTVNLSALASYDPGGYTPLTYTWTTVSVPSTSTANLTSTSATPTFVPDKVGSYVFELGVTNRLGLADPTPDRVRLTVSAPPTQPPVADAGSDQTVRPLQNVTLDGTASYDPQGLTPLAYKWTMVSRPSGSTTSISSTTASRPTFFADLAGRYEFDLDVKNSQGVWDGTPDRVVVDATPADGFYVEVSWDSTADLDVHLVNGTGSLFVRPGDCNFCNMTPNWGGSGTGDDPSLDADAILGYGPETITITTPASGTYDVKVHYYGVGGNSNCGGACPATNATARVYLGGVLAATYTKRLTQDDQVWNVARLAWPSGLLTADGTITTTTQSSCQ